jgi:AcrR family transcriptional regulator
VSRTVDIVHRMQRPLSARDPQLPHDAQSLLAETVALLETSPAESITAAELASAASLPVETIEQHFGSLTALIDQALPSRFARYVDDTIITLAMVLQDAKSREEFREWLVQITIGTQAPDRAPRRLERAAAFARAAHSEQFRATLAVEQLRLTHAMLDLIAGVQGRGWISPENDPMAVAVMV